MIDLINNRGVMIKEEGPIMSFIKSLLLVILIPVTVSSFTFATNYGIQNEQLKTVGVNQKLLLDELKHARTDINILKTNQIHANESITAMNANMNKQHELINQATIDINVIQAKLENTNRIVNRL